MFPLHLMSGLQLHPKPGVKGSLPAPQPSLEARLGLCQGSRT